ncbi:uncharacterized protein LOC122074370 [Macadamia integrifolia]|uniref:uncharacterized protein LOC122074370 n=1 Tax=Macadamia integrifolia TaxID=60698 RepID=UPI001C4F85B5|nr:uncharacterized protein LOC122074370 [Macadamia integrifolia]
MKNDSAKAQKFKKGLRSSIEAMLVAHRLQNYADVVQIAKSIEDKQRESYQIQAARRARAGNTGQFGRFGRGASSSAPQPGHYATFCPQRKPSGQSVASSSASTKKSQASGKVFALTAEEAEAAPGVMTGIVLVSSILAHVLFDSDASHSFVSSNFAQSSM